MTQTIAVPIYDDSYKEGDETFWLTSVGVSGYCKSSLMESLHVTNVKNYMQREVA